MYTHFNKKTHSFAIFTSLTSSSSVFYLYLSREVLLLNGSIELLGVPRLPNGLLF